MHQPLATRRVSGPESDGDACLARRVLPDAESEKRERRDTKGENHAAWRRSELPNTAANQLPPINWSYSDTRNSMELLRTKSTE